MNEHNDRIVSEYQGADFNRRLHLYLQYPQLRSEFILIDQKELNTELAVDVSSCKNSLADQVSEILVSVAAGVKKIIGIASA